MSTASHESRVEPFWTVQPVYDPDGGGADFAYTIGLAHRGFPELHIWARPSLGDDPGHDWKLSVRDCCGVLHELAALLVTGDLEVGSTVRREYDGGLAVVEYRVDPPGDREQLEAYGAPDGADVLPVRWSLSRPPAGPALPLSELEVRRMTKRYDELVDRLTGRDGLPKGWGLPDEPSFDVDQRFGPLTPLVLARAAHMSQVDADTLKDFLGVSLDVEQAANPTWPVVRARALGRPFGRTRPLDGLHGAVEELMEAWSRQRRQRKRWQSVVDQVITDARGSLPGVPRSRVDANLRRLLHTAVEACLAGEMVFDVADTQLRLMAAGPWQAATSEDGWPGPEWRAADAVLGRIRGVLSELCVHQLAVIASRHADRLEDDRAASPTSYGAVVSRMTGFAVISAAVCPRAEEVVPEDVRPLVVGRRILAAVQEDGRARFALDAWLSCLSVVLVHRAHFTDEHVHTFCAPVEDLLPDLRRVLDDPL